MRISSGIDDRTIISEIDRPIEILAGGQSIALVESGGGIVILANERMPLVIRYAGKQHVFAEGELNVIEPEELGEYEKRILDASSAILDAKE